MCGLGTGIEEVNFGPANHMLFLSGPSVKPKVGSPIVWKGQGVAGEMPVPNSAIRTQTR